MFEVKLSIKMPTTKNRNYRMFLQGLKLCLEML